MPSWEGIEDAAAVASPVWLERYTDKPDADWKPLRKCDCLRLSDAVAGNQNTVYIEGGRATADLTSGTISYNFVRGSDRQLCSAIWFVKEEHQKDKKVAAVEPIMNEADAAKIEELYQKAVKAATFYGDGIQSVLSEEITLEDESRVMVVKSSGMLCMKKATKGWFSSQYDLQRGYGEYIVEGEADEACLGPVRHLFLCVHGIGEALFSRGDVSFPSMVEITNSMRMSVNKRQVADWKKRCEKARKQGQPEPSPPNRMEVIQVEWFHHLHDSSTSLMKSLKAATLQSIPALRAIANDVVFDVLMYLTPEFCQTVLECVTLQINSFYDKFLQIHPEFLSGGGKCSLIGHSLGSVIVWDLLSLLKDQKRQPAEEISELAAAASSAGQEPLPRPPLQGVAVGGDTVEVGYRAYAAKAHANTVSNGTWGPSLKQTIQETICFDPDTTIFLGSPLGIFLTLRGAHAVFDEMRNAQARENEKHDDGNPVAAASQLANGDSQQVSPFTLPTNSLYNIFHPSDPVAYRIEPLLLPQDMDDKDLPPPVYLTTPGKDLRLHLKAKKFGEDLKKGLADTKNVWSSVISATASAFGGDINTISSPEQIVDANLVRSDALSFPLGGTSPRVDFSVQTGVIDNEYVSAVSAHSSYFSNSDIQDFVIGIVNRAEAESSNDDKMIESKE